MSDVKNLNVDTQDLKDVLLLAFSLGEGVDASLVDGKFVVAEDIANFIPVLTRIYPALEGIENVDDILLSMDNEDAEQLYAWAEAEFDLNADNVEELVEKALKFALQAVVFVNSFLNR